MKRTMWGTIACLLAAMTGCQQPCTCNPPSTEQNLDELLVKAVQIRPVDNAIIAQHTLYSYHFVPDSADLNALGQRDLRVLATHFRDKHGTLNVCQGDATDDLYRARVDQVHKLLLQNSVPEGAVTIADTLPGGRGISSDDAVRVVATKKIEGNDPMSPEAVDAAMTKNGSSSGGGMK